MIGNAKSLSRSLEDLTDLPLMLLVVFCLGYIPAATSEDVELAVVAAREAFTRNKGKDWSRASGAVRARYLRAIAAKVLMIYLAFFVT